MTTQNTLQVDITTVQNKFKTTQSIVQRKRVDIATLDTEIHAITTHELREAERKLKAATLKLTQAIDVARPENSRLTLAIEKTDYIIESIKQNTQAAAGEDVQEAPIGGGTTDADASAGAGSTAQPSEKTTAAASLLEVDVIPTEAADVGPRFVAAIVKLNDLKLAIDVLRNNSLQVFQLKGNPKKNLQRHKFHVF